MGKGHIGDKDTMKIKEGVIMNGLKFQMRHAIMMANQIWAEYGQELVITSALDSEHSPGSLHYYGYAVDLRTRYFDEKVKLKVIKELSDGLRLLDTGYRMVVHDTHIHIDWSGLVNDKSYTRALKKLHGMKYGNA
jgi:hypothetical protein